MQLIKGGRSRGAALASMRPRLEAGECEIAVSVENGNG